MSVVGFADFAGEFGGLRQDVLVDGLHLGEAHSVAAVGHGARIEVVGFAGGGVGFGERAEEEAEGVAELAVDLFGEAAEQRQAGDDVFAEVDARRPRGGRCRRRAGP